MKEPTLVILAAGMGSRFGGLKQITAVDDFGHAIIDFSLYDAHRAGFKNVVFIIKHEIEDAFKDFIGHRAEKYFNVKYVYQQLDNLPEGYSLPEGRVKPWGTGHAVMCCAGVIDGPFAVLNADDYYGRGAFSSLYGFLSSELEDNEHAMVAYKLRNTVTESGSVARGVCTVNNGFLTDVVERTKIEKHGQDGLVIEENESFVLPGDTPVSMNCWGYGNSMLDELKKRFPKWLDSNLPVNPLKAEYFLPYVTDSIIKEGLGSVRILDCDETWYGITYKDDLENVKLHLAEKRAQGLYPETLLD